MKKCLSINQQRGSSLVEAIVALLLLAFVSKGAIYLSSRASAAQGEIRLQEMALVQLRSELIENGRRTICATDPPTTPEIFLPGITLADEIDVRGCDQTITATILAEGEPSSSSKDITVPAPIVLSVTHPSIGGQMVVGGTW